MFNLLHEGLLLGSEIKNRTLCCCCCVFFFSFQFKDSRPIYRTEKLKNRLTSCQSSTSSCTPLTALVSIAFIITILAVSGRFSTSSQYSLDLYSTFADELINIAKQVLQVYCHQLLSVDCYRIHAVEPCPEAPNLVSTLRCRSSEFRISFFLPY